MPKLGTDPTQVGSTFQFSSVDINSLNASEYTLVGIAVDESGSVASFASEEVAAIKSIIEACRKSPRADNLMLRMTAFETRLREEHGFKLLADCNPDDYNNAVRPGSMTALYDGAYNAVEAVTSYGHTLSTNRYTVNGIVFVITDGCNNSGTVTVGEVKKALERAVASESLESIITVLIGVNVTNSGVAQALASFAKDAGFTQYVEIANASASTLAKLAAFISKSISSQSQALGTGGASKTLTF